MSWFVSEYEAWRREREAVERRNNVAANRMVLRWVHVWPVVVGTLMWAAFGYAGWWLIHVHGQH